MVEFSWRTHCFSLPISHLSILLITIMWIEYFSQGHRQHIPSNLQTYDWDHNALTTRICATTDVNLWSLYLNKRSTMPQKGSPESRAITRWWSMYQELSCLQLCNYNVSKTAEMLLFSLIHWQGSLTKNY